MKTPKLIISVVCILAVVISFLIGNSLREREYLKQREERCATLIHFAIDKAQNEDLSDEKVMKALISNVYAAYQFCDNSYSAGLLHDLWNELIFDDEKYIESPDILVSQLVNFEEQIKAKNR